MTRHLDPNAQWRLGSAIGEESLATAMIDISDGLSTDLGHITEESRCGAIVFAESIPVAQCARDYAQTERAVDPLELALHGGEEYELLFTSRPENVARVLQMARETGNIITGIGEITSEKRMTLRRNGEDHKLPGRGYEHLI
jgi:thiamine-monophosphate kinase